MTVSILEVGHLYCSSDLTKVFLNEQDAIDAVPDGFREIERLYYRHRIAERWLTIKTYHVEE